MVLLAFFILRSWVMVQDHLHFYVVSVMSCELPNAPLTRTPRITVPIMIAGAISPDNLPQCGDVEA